MRVPGAQAVITEETDGSLGIDNLIEFFPLCAETTFIRMGFTFHPLARSEQIDWFSVGPSQRYRCCRIRTEGVPLYKLIIEYSRCPCAQRDEPVD